MCDSRRDDRRKVGRRNPTKEMGVSCARTSDYAFVSVLNPEPIQSSAMIMRQQVYINARIAAFFRPPTKLAQCVYDQVAYTPPFGTANSLRMSINQRDENIWAKGKILRAA